MPTSFAAIQIALRVQRAVGNGELFRDNKSTHKGVPSDLGVLLFS